MSSLGDHPIFEEYLLDDSALGDAFSLLDKRFNTKGNAYQIQPDKIDSAIRAAQCAYKRIQELSEVNRQWLIAFPLRLPELKKAFVLDEGRIAQLGRLSRIMIESRLIHAALADISTFLTPARDFYPFTEEKFAKAKSACTFAVRCYPDLTEALQKDLDRIYALFHADQPESVSESQSFKELKAIFDKIPQRKKDQEFAPIDLDAIDKAGRTLIKIREATVGELNIESFHRTECELTESSEGILKRNMQLREEYYQALFQRIDSFFIRLLSHIFNESLFRQAGMEAVKIRFHEKLAALIPQVSRSIVLQQPRALSRFEKQLIIDSFSSFASFMRDFSAASSAEADRVDAIYSKIRTKLQIKADKPFDSDTLKGHLTEKIESIITLLTFSEEEQDTLQNRLFQLLLAPVALQLVNRLFSPNTIIYLLHRILEGRMWEVPSSDQEPPLAAYRADDQTFSKEVGEKVSELFREFLKFGEAGGIVASAGSLLRKLLHSKREMIGRIIQSKLTQLTSNECPVEPLRFLDMLLFSEEEGDWVPAATDFFRKSAKEKQLFAEKFRSGLETKYFPMLIAKVKAKSKGGSLALKLNSSRNFYKTLTERAWALISDDKLLKALVFYLLDGVQHSLETELKRKKHDRHSGTLSAPSSYLVGRT